MLSRMFMLLFPPTKNVKDDQELSIFKHDKKTYTTEAKYW